MSQPTTLSPSMVEVPKFEPEDRGPKNQRLSKNQRLITTPAVPQEVDPSMGNFFQELSSARAAFKKVFL